MIRKLLLAAALVVLFGLFGVGVVGFAVLRGCGRADPPAPPAPHAPRAPNWKRKQPAPIEHEKPPEQPRPVYDLPLEITIEDLPEVPEQIIGPSPPIKEEEEE